MVCFNYQSGATMQLPEEWKSKMLAYEGST
jgi:hypothetical protein